MSDFESLLQKPGSKPSESEIHQWFDRIAHRLLCGTDVMIGGRPHRYIEIEMYYYHSEDHPDIFAHRDPIQLHCGRWYFHRTQGTYRSGSFKGLDLSFGDGTAYGGVLIRGIETPDGEIIDGPSLHVDYLLKQTGQPGVASLDAVIDEKQAWDTSNPIHLVSNGIHERELYKTARVGLSLKRSRKSPLPPKYVLMPYRYITEPKKTAKGKLHLILGLHAEGKDVEEIKAITGSTAKTIQRYIEDYAIGQETEDFTDYFGKDLKPKDLCQLHGTWQAHYGS